jgi:hypothetical protein
MGEWRYSCIIRNLGARWRGVVTFTHRPLNPQGKSPRYPLDRRLGGPRVGLVAVEKENSFASAPSHSLVAMTAELFLLLSESKAAEE